MPIQEAAKAETKAARKTGTVATTSVRPPSTEITPIHADGNSR
jgi:hypothetical protein